MDPLVTLGFRLNPGSNGPWGAQTHRLPNPADLQEDRISAPHAAFETVLLKFHARARIPDPPGRRQTRSVRLSGGGEAVSADQPLIAGETASSGDRVDETESAETDTVSEPHAPMSGGPKGFSSFRELVK